MALYQTVEADRRAEVLDLVDPAYREMIMDGANSISVIDGSDSENEWNQPANRPGMGDRAPANDNQFWGEQPDSNIQSFPVDASPE